MPRHLWSHHTKFRVDMHISKVQERGVNNDKKELSVCFDRWIS